MSKKLSSVILEIPIENHSILSVHAIVRSIPHRREVLRGEWNGRMVYAKIFTGERACTHQARDVAGTMLLQAKGIATPALLYQGEIHDAQFDIGAFILIYAAILNTNNAEVAYLEKEDAGRLGLLMQLVKTIAIHHKAGIYQSDLHFKNFLVQSSQAVDCLANKKLDVSKEEEKKALTQDSIIFTIDGDGIRSLPRLFKSDSMRKNIATFFSKMHVLDDAWIPQLYAMYASDLNIACSSQTIARVTRKMRRIRMQVANRYADKKVFRSCTDVIFKGFLETHTFIWLSQTYAHLLPIFTIDALDQCLLSPAFKTGNTCTVGLFAAQSSVAQPNAQSATHATESIVVKRYNIKHVFHAMLRCLRTTRAATSWANAHRLMTLGVSTATPIALIEKRYFFNMLKSKSYFLTHYIDAPDVATYFAIELDPVKRANVVHEIALMFYRLYLLKLSHGDMKASNVKVLHGKPILIDLDSMQQHRCSWLFERKHARDIKRFMRNWPTNKTLDRTMIIMLQDAFNTVYVNASTKVLAKMHTNLVT